MILTSVLLTSLDTLPMRQIVHMLAHGQQAGDQALGLGPHKRHKQAWICSHGASNELQSTSFPNEWSRETLLFGQLDYATLPLALQKALLTINCYCTPGMLG